MADITDLLGNAIDKNPIDFADAFNQIMQQKQVDALEAKKIELAQSMYSAPDEVEDEDDFDFTEDDFDDSDVDDELDIDLDDLDLDDLDIDLEDLDLEDIADEDA